MAKVKTETKSAKVTKENLKIYFKEVYPKKKKTDILSQFLLLSESGHDLHLALTMLKTLISNSGDLFLDGEEF